MAAKTEDIYIRIKLDSSGAASEVLGLSDAMDKLQARMDSLRKAGKSDNDSEVQHIARQMANIDTLIKQNRQWFKDIEAIMSHLLQSTTKELKAALKQLNKEMNEATRKGGDVAKIAEIQERTNRIQGELNRRNAQARALTIDIKNLTNLTADELKRATDQAGALVKTLPKGTAEMRQTLSMYQRFRERQEKNAGEMSLGLASRLASGSKKGNLSQLQEAGKYLRQYRDEWGQFMNATMGAKMDDRIKKITERTVQMARDIANGNVKASFQDMQTALTIVGEKWKSLDPAVKKNQQLIRELGLEYNNLKSMIDAWGGATMTRADAGNVLAQSLRLIKQGTDADATAVRYYIEQLKLAEQAEGLNVAQVQQLSSAGQQLQSMMKGSADTVVSATQAQKAYVEAQNLIAQGVNASAKSVSDYIKLMREASTAQGVSVQQSHLYLEAEKQLTDLLKNKVEVTMTSAQATAAYANAQALISQGATADAAAVRASIDAMRDAQKAQGITVQQSQEYYTAEKQLTDLLQTKIKSVMTSTEASRAYATAQGLIVQGTTADATAVRASIEALKQAQQAQGVSVQTAQQYYTAEKQLTDLLQTKITTTMSAGQASTEYARAQRLITQGSMADAAAIRASIEAMREAQTAQGINAQQARQYHATEQQLTDLLKGKVEVLMNSAQALKAYRVAQGFISLGNTADAASVRASIDAMRDAQKARGITVQQAQEYYTAEKQLTDLLQTKVQSLMSATEAQTAYATAQNLINQGATADATAVRASIDAMKQAQQAQGISVQTAQQYFTAEKQLSDLLQTRVQQTMTLTDVQNAYAQARNLLTLGTHANAEAVRQNIKELQNAQKAQGQSVSMVQELYTAEKQLTDLLQTKIQSQMTYTEATNAYLTALNLSYQGTTADAAAVRASIDAMREAQKARGISVRDAQQYYNMEKQLTDMLHQKNAVYRDAALEEQRADALIQQGANAEVTAVRASIEALRDLTKQQGISTGQAQRFNEKIKELEGLTKAVSTASKNAHPPFDPTFIEKTMRNLRAVPLQDLEKAAKMLEDRMKTLQRNTKDYVNTANQLRQAKANLDGVNKSIKEQEGFLERAGSKLMSYLGIFGTFYFVRQKVTEAFQANLKYDDSLTNIRKTTQLTTEATAQLAENIKKINTRTSLEGITDLAYAAGRLGVKGTADIMGFVRAADQINIALGEQLNGAESVEQLMKITQLMGVNDEMGLEQALLKTGSAINVLTMNSQATAQPMVDFMRRTAGVATQAGMTTAELTGLAGAVNALGQNVEMSATSISKMMVQISSNSKKVAAALKMDAQEAESFFYNIAEGNMMGALMTVLQKVREQGGLSHLGTIVKDLGSKGQRVVQTIATLAQNYGKVREMVEMSTQAFEEGTSATNEYNLKNANTAALWEKLQNAFSKKWVSLENVEYIRQILLSLQSLPDAVSSAANGFTWLLGVLKMLIGFVTKCTFVITAFGYALATKAAWTFASGAISAGRAVVALVVDLGRGIVAANSFRGALVAVNTAIKSNVFLLLATALASVVTYFTEAKKAATEFKQGISEALQDIKTQSQDTDHHVQSLLTKLEECWEDEDKRKAVINDMNSEFGEYLGNLLNELDSYEKIEEALKGVNAQMRLKATLDGKKDSAKKIEEESNMGIGESRSDLVNTIMKYMKNADATTARDIADEMIARADRILDVDKRNENGEAIDYSKHSVTWWGVRESDKPFSEAMIEAARAAGGTFKKEWKDAVSGMSRLAMGGEEYNNIASALAEYMNKYAMKEEKIRYSNSQYDADAKQQAKKAYETFGPEMEKTWDVVAKAVTQNGNLVAKTIQDANGVMRAEGFAIKNDQQDDKKFWVDRRKKMTDTQRNQEILDLENYLLFARNAAEDLKLTNQEEYLKASVNISNAEEYLKILKLGNIENKTDNGAAAKAARDARQEMDNLIQKIKTFYEIQANAYKEMRQKQQITETEYQRNLEQNNRDMSASLADAYAALAQDADMTEERYKQIAERMKEENKRSRAGEIGETQIGIVSGTSYASVQNINKQLSGDKENGTAWTNSMRRKRREEEGNVIESLNKEMQARIKAWLEQNPLGKIAQDFQKQFEEMGLLIHIKPEVDADGVEIRNLDQVQNDLMKQMLEIGRTVSAYNVTTAEGRKEFAAYVKDLEKFPDVARTVVMETDTDISSFYYKIYEYAEQYEEQMKRLTDRTMKMWTKMYADTPAHRAIQEELNGLALLQKRYTELEKFGLHQRFNMDANVRKAQLEYDNAIAALEDKAARARAHMASAQALKVGDKTTDGTDVTAQFRDAEIASAQAEIDALQSEGQQVVEIYGKVIDAQAAVREATYEWVASMKDAFAKFADGFAPFRSWYEDNGSFAENVFGTKSERQEAFGQFMDDLKKLVRAALMEQMQLKMSQWLNLPDKADAYSKSSSKPAEDAVGNIIGKSDAEVDIVSLEENKTSELDVIKASNYQKEEEARRHKAEMDAIESGSSSGNVMDEDTKSSLKAKAFAEEMSIEQAMEEQKLNMKAAAEQSLQNVAMQGIQKMLKQKQKAAKEEFKITKLSAKDRTKIEEEANEETGESAIGLAGIQAQISERIKNIRIDNSKQTAAQEQSDDVASAGVSMWGSFGGAVAKAWEEGGPYLGPVLAAVVSAAVGSLITWVMNMMGSSSKSASAAPKTKLVSGMLTYDSGNVQSFRGIPTYDGGGSAPKNINMLPVMGDDGRVYMVPEGDMMGKNNMSGFTGIVSRPTLTTVGGAPALVAERGPEMVIGRETTHAMMMSRPDLLRAIVEFDRNRSRGFAKTFDSGNVGDIATVSEASPEGNNSQLMEVLDAQTAMLAQMYEINAQLTAELRKGIGVRKYGAGGLIEETAAGFAEARRLGNNKNVTRLFGK